MPTNVSADVVRMFSLPIKRRRFYRAVNFSSRPARHQKSLWHHVESSTGIGGDVTKTAAESFIIYQAPVVSREVLVKGTYVLFPMTSFNVDVKWYFNWLFSCDLIPRGLSVRIIVFNFCFMDDCFFSVLMDNFILDLI